MTSVTIHASKEYSVLIGKDILSSIGSRLSSLISSKQVAIITDSIVENLYLSTVKESLEQAGFTVFHFTFPHGEASKNMSIYTKLLEYLSSVHMTRSDCILALGGGVTGDMAGFAAATYLRGIKFVQVPTTLLAAVDSSVGGKTAVNLSTGKNLVGAFYQPSAVYCDYSTLGTLSKEELANGYAEVIKYAMLNDAELFSILSDTSGSRMEDIITRCVLQKSEYVNKDEHDVGLRQLLNFGHTIGHAVEACSHYTISHGRAVAIGMIIMTRACVKKQLCTPNTLTRLVTLLTAYGLPVTCQFSAKELHQVALGDKKHIDGMLTIVIPHAVGNCVLHKITDEDLLSYIQLGLS